MPEMPNLQQLTEFARALAGLGLPGIAMWLIWNLRLIARDLIDAWARLSIAKLGLRSNGAPTVSRF